MKPALSIKLSVLFLIAFVSIRHLFHETHEMMHMALGRYLCGTWGTRDFNNVHPINDQCAQSINPLVGLEGPLFNYIAIWIGAMLIRTAKGTKKLSWGIVLIFVNLPMARLITAFSGGGDELGVAKHMIHNPLVAKIVVCTLICSILFYPLLLVYQRMQMPHRLYIFLGFLILPMLFEGAIVLGLFNHLLNTGIMNQILFMGMPTLICTVLLADLIIALLFIKNIGGMLKYV